MSSEGSRHVRGVAALVSSYHPDDRLTAVCASLAGQVDRVVVVDDGTGPAADAVLAACAATGAVVVRHPENRGIGAALCTAAARAADDEPTWYLTVDQDSVLPSGYVADLLAAAEAARSAGLDPALVGPGHVEDVGSRVAGRQGDVVLGREPLQSGLLVATDLPPAPGGGPFDADLFIDGVDTELFLRARAAGRAVVVAPGAAIGHRLGTTTAAVAGRGPRLVHAAPFRYYYIARNRVHLVRRYGRHSPGWALGAVLRDVRHLAVTTVLLPGRLTRWRATLRGAADGMRGVVGPDPAGTPARQPTTSRPEHDVPHQH